MPYLPPLPWAIARFCPLELTPSPAAAVVAMVDEGSVDGDTVRVYINHIDTPPNAARRGIQRNVMTGTLPTPGNGNVMKFRWVAEQSPTQTGEIVMIGPIR